MFDTSKHRQKADPVPAIDLPQALDIGSIKVLDKKYIVIESKSTVRVIGAVRLLGRPKIPSAEMTSDRYLDRREYSSIFLKMKDLFTGLQKGGIPCIYMVLLNPVAQGSSIVKSEIEKLEFIVSKLRSDRQEPIDEEALRERERELRRLYEGAEQGFFQTEILFLPWVDGHKDELEDLTHRLNDNVNRLIASTTAIFPEMEATLLEKKELTEVLRSFLSPSLPPQIS